MKPLSEMTFGQRFALTLVIVLVILFILAFSGYLTGRWDDAGAEPLPPSRYDTQINELDRQAVADAYRGQVEHLFATWMKDSTGQPERATTGVRQARRAFIDAMTEIDKKVPK